MPTVNLQWSYNTLTWAIWQVQQGTDGWTEIPIVQPGNKVIYFAPESGSDSNDGLSASTPIASKAELLSIMNAGDHVRCRCGESLVGWDFTGVPNGTSEANRTIFYTYDDHIGIRPRLTQNDGQFTYTSNAAVKYTWYIGIDFHSGTYDPDDPAFSPTIDQSGAKPHKFSFLRDTTDLLFEDCKFSYVEVSIHAWSGLSPSNIKLRRNIFTGTYEFGTTTDSTKKPSNLFVADVTDILVIEDNVLDYGGWNRYVEGAGANNRNHNIYLQYSSTGNNIIRNNIITRGSGYGMHVRSGGYVYDNFLARNTVQVSFGYNLGFELPEGAVAHAYDNVLSETSSYDKGATANDITNATTPRGSAVWGLVLYESPNTIDARFENNIVSLLDTEYPCQVTPNLVSIASDPQLVKVDNIEYKMESPTQGVGPVYTAPETTLDDVYTGSSALFTELEANGVIPTPVAGYDDFDSYMNIVKSRHRGQWDNRLTANAINNQFRVGFNKAPVSYDKVYA